MSIVKFYLFNILSLPLTVTCLSTVIALIRRRFFFSAISSLTCLHTNAISRWSAHAFTRRKAHSYKRGKTITLHASRNVQTPWTAHPFREKQYVSYLANHRPSVNRRWSNFMFTVSSFEVRGESATAKFLIRLKLPWLSKHRIEIIKQFQ